jgi:hypothetical protein
MGARREKTLREGGPAEVGRCPHCKTIFHSRYAQRAHECAGAQKREDDQSA